MILLTQVLPVKPKPPLGQRSPLLSNNKSLHYHTVVYFESIPHSPPCLHNNYKYSFTQQMCINLPVKIVPNKCIVNALLFKFAKDDSTQLF